MTTFGAGTSRWTSETTIGYKVAPLTPVWVVGFQQPPNAIKRTLSGYKSPELSMGQHLVLTFIAYNAFTSLFGKEALCLRSGLFPTTKQAFFGVHKKGVLLFAGLDAQAIVTLHVLWSKHGLHSHKRRR